MDAPSSHDRPATSIPDSAGDGCHAVNLQVRQSKIALSTVSADTRRTATPPPLCGRCGDTKIRNHGDVFAYEDAVDILLSARREDGVQGRLRGPRPAEIECDECPRCFCAALCSEHSSVEFGNCWAELEVYGEDVLPSDPRHEVGLLLPTRAGWAPVAQWRAEVAR